MKECGLREAARGGLAASLPQTGQRGPQRRLLTRATPAHPRGAPTPDETRRTVSQLRNESSSSGQPRWSHSASSDDCTAATATAATAPLATRLAPTSSDAGPAHSESGAFLERVTLQKIKVAEESRPSMPPSASSLRRESRPRASTTSRCMPASLHSSRAAIRSACESISAHSWSTWPELSASRARRRSEASCIPRTSASCILSSLRSIGSGISASCS